MSLKKLWIWSLCCILCAACGESNDDSSEPQFSSSVQSVQLENKEYSSYVYSFVISKNWSAELLTGKGMPDWISVSPREGRAGNNHVKITVIKENETLEDKQAVLRIVAEGLIKEIPVILPQKHILEVKPSLHVVSGSGATVELEVTTNVPYEIRIPDEVSSWIVPLDEPAATSGILRLKVEANISAFERVGKLNLVYQNLECEVEIRQEPAENIVDGKVLTLQQATIGKGVNIVLMGDGFTQEDIQDGTYEKVMKEGMEHFFGLEPTRSYRSYFNVYAVQAVSVDGEAGKGGNTAFSTKIIKDDVMIEGDDKKVFSYAKRINGLQLSQSPVIVILNSKAYAGVTWNYSDKSSIAYCPMSIEKYPYDFRGLIQHEAVGHAFGHFLDEYIQVNGRIDLESINSFKEYRSVFAMGWNLTIDLNEIPWKHFIGHPDYRDVGTFEGGFMFSRGVWRAEEYNCMINNISYFNAPCRELLVKRILELTDIPYSWEAFVNNDKADEIKLPAVRSLEFRPLAPPVWVNKTSEELLRE